MVLVRETCEYHSRGKVYMVLFQRDLWVLQQTGGIWCLPGGDLPVSTLNRQFIESNDIYFVQKCIVLAKNNVMSVLAPIRLNPVCHVW